MICKILLAYDGSESAKSAFEFALDLAKRYGAQLHCLAVAPPRVRRGSRGRSVVENSRRHYDHVLCGLRTKLSHAGVEAEFQVAVGHPAEQIVRYAEPHFSDQIVVGHRGHTLFERWPIGSVARQLVA